MRRVVTILIIIAILGGGGYYFYWQRQEAQNQEIEILREATIARGKISATVNATGSIEPEAMVSTSFGMAGTVLQVNVLRGQQVEAGEILATLETEELALAVQQAEDALAIQELSLEQLRSTAPSTATLAAGQADIDAAEGNLAIAEANLLAAQASRSQAVAQKNQLLAGPTEAEIASANAEIAARKAEVEALEQQYIALLLQGIGGPVEITTRFQLEAARKAHEAAQARLAALEAGARPADIAVANAAIAATDAQIASAEGSLLVAEANLARAQAAYNRLLEGPGEAEIAVLEAQVKAAETNLTLTQLRLEHSLIIAPISGKVANVLINPGEQVAPGAPAVTIVNETAFHIEVNVDEIDIDRIALNQPVEITLDALPDQVVMGAIAEIAPTALSSGGGVVIYLVTINIEAEDVTLRPGMTANASIIVEEIDDVLIVPNWAVRLDRDTGDAFVNRLVGPDLIEEVVVETGLRNEQFSEIISGLNAGDTVVVTNEREELSFFGN